jgi:hypothetical protein
MTRKSPNESIGSSLHDHDREKQNETAIHEERNEKKKRTTTLAIHKAHRNQGESGSSNMAAISATS